MFSFACLGITNQRKILLHCVFGDLVCRVPYLLDCHQVMLFLEGQICVIISFDSCEITVQGVESQAILLSMKFLYICRTVV